jgi:DNA-binding LytR/AlgR family response regulator
MWIEGLKDYIKIHLKSSSKPVVTRMPMKSIEEALPSSKFIRIHKSYIVSSAYVTSVRKNSVFIGPAELPVSESYPEALAVITGKKN